MKKILLTLAMALAIAPAFSADKVARSTPTICEGKASAEAYVKGLSDYELLRGITNIMADSRTASLRSANDLNVWLQYQSDCSVWAEGMYLLEVKWLYNEAVSRGLTTTINKVASGTLRWSSSQDLFEELNGTRWVPWSAYQK